MVLYSLPLKGEMVTNIADLIRKAGYPSYFAFAFATSVGLTGAIAADTNTASSQAPANFLSKAGTAYVSHPDMAALSASLKDGDIFFVKGDLATYAVKALSQSMSPEFISYEYLKVGSKSPSRRAESTKGFPIEIIVGDIHVPWSGGDQGLGYLYLVSRNWSPTPRYEIGLPFIAGNLEHFRLAVPSDVQFKSLPW